MHLDTKHPLAAAGAGPWAGAGAGSRSSVTEVARLLDVRVVGRSRLVRVVDRPRVARVMALVRRRPETRPITDELILRYFILFPTVYVYFYVFFPIYL